MSDNLNIKQADHPDLKSLKKQLKELKAEKGKLSKSIGVLKKEGAPTENIMKRLAAISEEINSLSKQVKAQLKVEVSASKAAEENVAKASSELGSTQLAENLSQQQVLFNSVEQLTTSSVVYFNGELELAAEIDRFVDLHPSGTVYHKSNLYHFIDSTYEHKKAFLVALDTNKKVTGLLPLVQLKSRLFGNFIVSIPYFNYGGVLANNVATETALLAEACRWKEQIDASHIEYRHTVETVGGLPARTDKVSFILDLPNESDVLWKRFKPKLRAQIKRSSSHEPTFISGREELVDEFYRVFSRNMRDLGTPVYSRQFFVNALASFGELASIAVVRINNKAVGCAFLLGNKETLEIPWASTLKEFNPISINMFMYWEVLRFAVDKGYQHFDFGRCTKDCGTYKFKKQWGASPIPYYWHYQLPEGQDLPQLNPNNPKFKLLVAVWKRLPVFLANLIGPRVVKYLP